MKKLIVLAMLVLGFASLVSAQTGGNVAANLQVTIKQALSITETGSLNFGIAYPGYSVAAVNPQSASGIPVFTIAGEPSASVTVTLPSSAYLAYSGDTVSFTPVVNGNSANAQSGSSTLSLGTVTETLSAVGSGNVGDYYLWLGGQINSGNPLPALVPGAYAGTYTVTVNY